MTMGGHLGPVTNHNNIGDRVGSHQNLFLFGIKQNNPDDSISDTKINDDPANDKQPRYTDSQTTPIHQLLNQINDYKQQLNQNYDRIGKQIRRKHHRFLLSHNNTNQYSSAWRSHKTSVLQKIYRKIKWHKDADEETKEDVLHILTGVLDRTDPRVCLQLAEIFELYQHRIAKHKFDIGTVPGTNH